jgi:hypothetical protein
MTQIEQDNAEPAGEGRWFVRHRQAWIAEMLHIYGFINRLHLMRKFEVSTPQASYDLQQFMREHPGQMAYNQSTKRYEAIR